MVHEGTREMNPMEYQDQFLLVKNTTFHNDINKKPSFDSFAYATQCFIMRKMRRNFLTLHNVQ